MHNNIALHSPSSEDRPALSLILSLLGGFGLGGLIGAVIMMGLTGVTQRVFDIIPLDFILLGLFGFLFIFAVEGVVELLWKLTQLVLGLFKLDTSVRWLKEHQSTPIGRTLGVLLFVFGRILFPESFFASANAQPVQALVILAMAVGGVIISASYHPGASQSRKLRGGFLSALPLAIVIWYLLWPGNPSPLVTEASQLMGSPLDLPDPGQPGPYTIETLSYGSGDSQRRPEFGSEADLITPTVDGSPIYSGFNGFGATINRWIWGFGMDRLPLNGLIYAPQGEGPFPLVLIVHGNHASTDYSDPGYAYLGEHLASWGFITVSVDENFLNGFLIADGKGDEIPLRAWLLLKHLEQWRNWGADPENPFFGLVDMDSIALIGHSRGGEAITHAADVNRNNYLPYSRGSESGDFDFNIKAVIPLAPSDGMYQPNGKEVSLVDISYLVIDGAHDADTSAFYGLLGYQRAAFTGDVSEAFKAAGYFYRANHSQFNTIWRYGDKGGLDWLLLNRAVLLTAEEQQDATTTTITAFLKAVMGREPGYREFFTEPARAAAWLPDDPFLIQYEDASFIRVDENNFLSQPTLIEVDEGSAKASGMSIFAVESLPLRDTSVDQDSPMLHLAWEAGSEPVLRYQWPRASGEDWGLSADDALIFQIGAFSGSEPAPSPLISLETADGIRVERRLSDLITLQPPLISQALKTPWLAKILQADIVWDGQPEHMLQSVVLPLSAFTTVDPFFDPARITAIEFAFNGTSGGDLYLDQLGFSHFFSE